MSVDTDTAIAPREGPYTPIDVIGEMLAGAYPQHVTLRYHDLRLRRQNDGDATLQVWAVYGPGQSRAPVDVLNLNAFESAAAIEAHLAELDDRVSEDHAEGWREVADEY